MDAPVQELPFDRYTERQYKELEPEQLLYRALLSRPSGNFRLSKGIWEPQPYPGFAVVSMVGDNPENESLPQLLASVQAGLLEYCPWEGALYLLPPSSFHQTVANTLSEERFLEHIYRPGLEPVYPEMVARAFDRARDDAASRDRTREPASRDWACDDAGPQGPLPMRLIGLGIFGTALGVLGVFDDREAYEQILHLRTALYADETLAGLDVRRTRPFIGHISLAYIESDWTTDQRKQLALAAQRINETVFSEPPFFYIAHTRLRRYKHLAEFKDDPSYPRYQF